MKFLFGIAVISSILVLFLFSCNPTPTPNPAIGDTSHIDVYFAETDQLVHIYCTTGDTIYIPCPYEDDGVLTVICQDGIYVTCGDTSHGPSGETSYRSGGDTSHVLGGETSDRSSGDTSHGPSGETSYRSIGDTSHLPSGETSDRSIGDTSHVPNY